MIKHPKANNQNKQTIEAKDLEIMLNTKHFLLQNEKKRNEILMWTHTH